VSVIDFAPPRRRVKLLGTIGVICFLVSASSLWVAMTVPCDCTSDPFWVALVVVALASGFFLVSIVEAIVRALTFQADEVGLSWLSLLGRRRIRWADVVRVSFNHGGLTLKDRDRRRGGLGRADVVSWEDALAAVRSRVPSSADWV
jgi:hypothetical protein